MLFYIKCPSCSRIISFNMDKYYDDLQAIVENPNLNKKQKDEQSAQLLEKYKIDQICCRIRIMGLIPYHKIIVT